MMKMMKDNLEEATIQILQGKLVKNNNTKNINKQTVIADRENLQQTFIDLLTSNQI